MNRLNGKVAVVTGGTSGIGKAITKLFLEEGANVIATGRNEERGKILETELNDDKLLFMTHDVSDEKDWEKVAKEVTEKFGKWDILVNNAGVGGNDKLIANTTLDEWKSIIDINLTGNFLGVRTGLNHIDNGSIVNMSSVLAMLAGMPSIGSYAASKGGVMSLTKAAAVEAVTMGKKIRVNSVHPALVKTKLVPQPLQQMMEKSSEVVPAIGEPKDIANAVLYLASDESRYTNGAELVIDGGITAGRNLSD